jgi:undecaprenyl-diphosphatase
LHNHLSWLEAGIIGALQGVTELFPVSSLGHSVLIPAIIGGSWARDLNVSASESPYLAFIVGMHVATALALVVFFWKDWVRIAGGFFSSIARREVQTTDQKLAWLLILATIPVAFFGLVFEHWLKTHAAKPTPTAIFLIINGGVLLLAERLRGQGGALDSEYVDERITGPESDKNIVKLPVLQAVTVGAAQIGALFPGISRSGVTMVAGIFRGLDREDAARFSFLLATPVILLAGMLKLPELAGSDGDGIRGQVLFGSLLAGITAYLSVRFLTKYLANRSLTPFAYYCFVIGAASLVLFAVRSLAARRVRSERPAA